MLKKLLATAALLLAAAAGAMAATDPNEVPVPKLSAHVIDQTGTLAPAQRDALDAKLADFDRTHGSQVVVLIVPTLGNESIFDFATRVTDEWKLGRKGVDDGVLLVVSKDQHKIRIHTGRGVQGTLTDALSDRIIYEIIAPRFRNGDFAGGLDAGVDAILKAIEGESLPLPEARRPAARVSGDAFFYLAVFLVPIVGLALRGIFGRLFGAGITGGITGLLAWFLFGSIALVVAAAGAAFFFTLFSGARFGPGIGMGTGWPGGFGGGGFGGGGFGGGGGGFSGGGGGFDGGGASGSW